MPQISKRKLPHRAWQQALDQLIKLIAQESRAPETKLFLNHLLTKTEQIMLVKRTTAYLLLINNWSSLSIAKLLKMSPATVYGFQTKLDLNPRFRKYLKHRFPKPIKYNQKTAVKPTILLDILKFIEDVHVGYHHRNRLIYGRQPD